MRQRRVLAITAVALGIVSAQAPSAAAARHCRPVASGNLAITTRWRAASSSSFGSASAAAEKAASEDEHDDHLGAPADAAGVGLVGQLLDLLAHAARVSPEQPLAVRRVLDLERVEIGVERHLRVDRQPAAAGGRTTRSGLIAPSESASCSWEETSQCSDMPAASTGQDEPSRHAAVAERRHPSVPDWRVP